MRKIAVFFGGRSNEREISIITGMLAVNLLRERVKVYPVYLNEAGGMEYAAEADGVEDFDGRKTFPPVFLENGWLVFQKGWRRRIAKLDCALNCCHGGTGEDGTLSALLRWANIPLASPDTPLSSVFMNKELSQIAARGLGVPVVPSAAVRERAWLSAQGEQIERCEALGYPLIVKPSTLGSSIGISVAQNREELCKALELAFYYDNGALVEKYLQGKRDFNCAVYRRRGTTVTSPVEEVFSSQPILTFGEKYEEEGTRSSDFPAKISQELADRMREYTARIYDAFDGTGVVRADFLLCGEELYFNELNTVPGSLATYLFCRSLTESRSFLLSLIEERLAQVRAPKPTVTTGILKRGVFCGAKGCKKPSNRI